MMIPIPFVGWITIDEEETMETLREQLKMQQREIDRLNKEMFKMQILASKRYLYDPDGSGNDVWVIEKKKANEF
jgi:hemolysin-activating ACP:hemolysin acyltransferase